MVTEQSQDKGSKNSKMKAISQTEVKHRKSSHYLASATVAEISQLAFQAQKVKYESGFDKKLSISSQGSRKLSNQASGSAGGMQISSEPPE